MPRGQINARKFGLGKRGKSRSRSNEVLCCCPCCPLRFSNHVELMHHVKYTSLCFQKFHQRNMNITIKERTVCNVDTNIGSATKVAGNLKVDDNDDHFLLSSTQDDDGIEESEFVCYGCGVSSFLSISDIRKHYVTNPQCFLRNLEDSTRLGMTIGIPISTNEYNKRMSFLQKDDVGVGVAGIRRSQRVAQKINGLSGEQEAIAFKRSRLEDQTELSTLEQLDELPTHGADTTVPIIQKDVEGNIHVECYEVDYHQLTGHLLNIALEEEDASHVGVPLNISLHNKETNDVDVNVEVPINNNNNNHHHNNNNQNNQNNNNIIFDGVVGGQVPNDLEFPLGTSITIGDDHENQSLPVLDRLDEFCLDLVNLCRGQPKYMYDKIRFLIEKYLSNHTLTSATTIPSRDSFVGKMKKKFTLEPPKELLVGLDIELVKDKRNTKKDINKKISSLGSERVAVFTFSFQRDFEEMINSKHYFGNLENLVVNSDDKWGRYIPNESDGGEILSADWMQRTYDKLEEEYPGFSWETDQIHPIIFYGDKIGTDARQRFSSEPWMWCHGGLKRSVRNQPNSWRPLAYLPDLNFTSSAWRRLLKGRTLGKSNSQRNYMGVMAAATLAWRKFVKKPFMGWMRKGNQFKYVRHHLVTAYVMGDSLSNTTLCNTYRSFKANRLSRFCDITLTGCSNPLVQCSHIKMDHVKRLLERFFRSQNNNQNANNGGADKQEERYYYNGLKDISIHASSNPWFSMDYGANEFGLMRATPPDAMHLFELGILPYIFKCFLASLTDGVKMRLDAYIGNLFQCYRSSAKLKDIRINFTHGVTSVALMTAKEWPGLFLAIFQALLTDEGQEICKSCFHDDDVDILDADMDGALLGFDKDGNSLGFIYPPACLPIFEYEHIEEEEQQHIEENNNEGEEDLEEDDLEEEREKEEEVVKQVTLIRKTAKPLNCSVWQFLELLELLLSLNSLLRSSFSFVGKQQTDKDQFQNAMRKLMLKIVVFVPRDEGNGWQIQKFHELLHIAHGIDQYGSTLNFDAGTGERGLKEWVKQLVTTVQFRDVRTYNSQLADRVVETSLWNKINQMYSFMDTNCDTTNQDEEEDVNINDDTEVGGESEDHGKNQLVLPHYNYMFQWNPENKRVECLNNKKKRMGSRMGGHVHPTVVTYFDKQFKDVADEDRSVHVYLCYTEIKIGKHTFRARPKYRGENPWYDYCFINWEQDGTIPAKLLCFFQKKLRTELDFSKNNQGVKGISLLIHSALGMNEGGSSVVPYQDRLEMMHFNAISERWRMDCIRTSFVDTDDGRKRKIIYKTKVRCINTQTIAAPAFVLDEFRGIQETFHKLPTIWVLRHRDEWSKKFLDQPIHYNN